MRYLSNVWKFLSMAVLLVLVGCQVSLSAPLQVPTREIQQVALISNKPRIVQPKVDPADLTALAADQRAFAINLYRQINRNEDNVFFSPYSISMALAMAEAGARGATQGEIDFALHFTLPRDRLHPSLNALDQSLNTLA